jgi:hypothetical protein
MTVRMAEYPNTELTLAHLWGFLSPAVKRFRIYQGKKNRQEGGEMGEVPAGEGEEKSSFPFCALYFFLYNT